VAGGVERARADINDGRLWKARERLLGVIRSEPHNAEALDLAGMVYFSMGDHPAAGRFWALTTRDDDDARRARQALEEHAHSRRELLRTLPVTEPLDAYPVEVQSRIAALREETGWRPASDGWDDEESNEELSLLVTIAALLLTVGVWLFGLVAAVVLVVSAMLG
jgi:hypothetical protein